MREVLFMTSRCWRVPKERACEAVLVHGAWVKVVRMAVGMLCTPLVPVVGGVSGSGLVHVLSRVSGHTCAVTRSCAARRGTHRGAQGTMVCAWRL